MALELREVALFLFNSIISCHLNIHIAGYFALHATSYLQFAARKADCPLTRPSNNAIIRIRFARLAVVARMILSYGGYAAIRDYRQASAHSLSK
jgi:hypothetical protein